MVPLEVNQNEFIQYSTVKVSKLIQPDSEYDGWDVNQRMPQVGDVGILIEILEADGIPNMYVVECIDKGGQTIWLSDLFAEEIEEYSRGGDIS